MGDLDPDEELQNALGEIGRNEKDMNMIAMIAQTLFEKNDEMLGKVEDQEQMVTELSRVN